MIDCQQDSTKRHQPEGRTVARFLVLVYVMLISMGSLSLFKAKEASADVGRALIPLLVGADAQSQQFRDSLQRIQDGDVVEGLRKLQGLHEEIWGLDPLLEDYRDDNWLMTVPISDRISDYLHALPEGHRKIYLAEYQTRANSLLAKATQERSPRKLYRVAKLYPLMSFCRDTLVRAGELFFEEDQPEAAYSVWNQALAPEFGEVEEQLRKSISQRMALAAARSGNSKQMSLHAGELAEDVVLPVSGPGQRRDQLISPLPFSEGRIAWKTSDYSRHVYEDSRSLRGYFVADQNALIAPGVGQDTLAVATSAKLLRYDLRTGKLISDFNLRPGDSTFQEQDPQMRLWAVEQKPYVLASYVARASRRENYLGYDIQVSLPWRGIKCWNTNVDGGRLLWDTAHRSVSDEELRTTSFNTRPVLHEGRVYALGWRKSGYIDVSVWCLDAETGEKIWVRPIVGNQVDLTMFGEPSREPILGSLLLDGDVVYCCSNLGAIAAVRIWDGKVKWVSEYEQIAPRKRGRRYNNRYREQVWKPNPLYLHEGMLFVTPLDSASLYCISVTDGSLVNRISNSEGALGPHMLGISGNRLVLAGDLVTSMIAHDPGREELWRQSIVRNPARSRPALVEEGVLYMNNQDGGLYLQSLRQGRSATQIASIVRRGARDRVDRWGDPLLANEGFSGRVDVAGDKILITHLQRSACVRTAEKEKK
ncbi:MAG: hypothetical protein CBC13_01510 [Planctomycetia bacterium TMED53]|nr:MAG: hypothetical protein CBC13_01510 [Planctomycetia bacterium TMED53]